MCHACRQKRQPQQLGCVGFSSGDGLFLTCVKGDDVIGRLRKRRIGDIGEGKGCRALRSGTGEHRNNIGALAALRNANDQRVLKFRRAMINAVERGRGKTDGQPVDRAEQVLSIPSRVVAGAACGDKDIGNVARVDFVGDALNIGAFDGKQVGEHRGLLMDFLIEKGLGEHLDFRISIFDFRLNA